MRINLKEAAEFLKEHDNYNILTHQSPDGDTMGAGFGLCHALREMGKNANVLCSDEFPKRYGFMFRDYEPQKFSPQTVIAVDVADAKLLGTPLSAYSDFVELCIDHHVSNTDYAKRLLVYPNASAACEVVYRVLAEMGYVPDRLTAECLYTGIATDTGCFKYGNTTKLAHTIAAKLMEYGADIETINREMFDKKSKRRLAAEQHILTNMEYYLDDKCTVTLVTLKDMEEKGFSSEELEGTAGITVQPEGVEVGVLIKEKEKGKFKISMRSASEVDVSAICAKFDGGGHVKAAGCKIDGEPEEIKLKLLMGVAPALGIDLWLA